MEFRTYLQLARKWLWLILLLTFIAAAAGLGVSLRLAPRYEASISLLVSSGGTTPTTNGYTDLLASVQLAQTYVQLIQERPVLEATLDELRLPVSPGRLASALNVRVVPNTQLVEVRVRFSDPTLAAEIANSLGKVFIQLNQDRQRSTTHASSQYLQDQLTSLQSQISDSQQRIADLRTQPSSAVQQAAIADEQSRLASFQSSYSTIVANIQSIRLADASLSGTVALVEPAAPPTKPVSPNIPLNVALSGVLGLLVAIGAIVLCEHLDDKVRTPERVGDSVGLATLGRLFEFKDNEPSPERLTSHSAEAEAYRMLRTNLEFSSLNKPWRSLLVTSSTPSEGKTTVACSLAVMMAQEGKNVLLVDLDLRRPGVHQHFNVPNERGLTNLILRKVQDQRAPSAGRLSLNLPPTSSGSRAEPLDRSQQHRPDCSLVSEYGREYVIQTSYPTLSVLTTGPLPPNPAELIGSTSLTRVLDDLGQVFDIVIYDSSPVLAVTDPVVLSSHADATLVVVNSKLTRISQLRSTCEHLQKVGATVLGVALNRDHLDPPSTYYRYYTDGSHTTDRGIRRFPNNGTLPNGHRPTAPREEHPAGGIAGLRSVTIQATSPGAKELNRPTQG